VHGLHLADQPRAGGLDGRREWTGIPEGEHDRCELPRKRAVEQVRALLQGPGDEAAADPGVASACPLPFDPVAVAIATAEQAETHGLADRRGEPAAGHEVHGGE
jgi:hypothetical protein